MNLFVVSGKVISYGISQMKDWIEIQTNDGAITVYLQDNGLDDLERSYDLQNATIVATGYLLPQIDTDLVVAIAKSVEVLQ